MISLLTRLQLLILPFMLLPLQGNAQSAVPVIDLNMLDSMVKQQPHTAIYYWGTWCAPCIAKLPTVTKNFAAKKQTRLLVIADPSSSNDKINSMAQKYSAGTLVTFYKRANTAPPLLSARRVVSLNDMQQTRIFNRHFTNNPSKEANMVFPAFYLLDQAGAVVARCDKNMSIDNAISQALGIAK